LVLDFKFIQAMPLGHRMFLSLSDAAGKIVMEQLLTASTSTVALPLNSETAAPAKAAHTFADFVLMGIEHIGTGYDHLLFLFALLVVTRSFRSALAVITAFTLAHSITLAISTFNLYTLSPRMTEPLIAATIVYVGLENLWRRGDPHQRWLLTFSFGLIHGFGFASVLREMGVGDRTGGVVLPLFGFNLGVELGQLAVAAMVLPIVWKLRTKEKFLRYGVPLCSILAALAGSFWFIQRVWFS
ncbi:MAG TPA: HupE/UreJ family protein, partial [bacterium]|nr:HupE/UreJ family protein [bacterium]